MSKLFEMTEEQLGALLDACKSAPLVATHCGPVMTPQERANNAWRDLGEELGFDFMTVTGSDKGQRFFYADAIKKNTNPKENQNV